MTPEKFDKVATRFRNFKRVSSGSILQYLGMPREKGEALLKKWEEAGLIDSGNRGIVFLENEVSD